MCRKEPCKTDRRTDLFNRPRFLLEALPKERKCEGHPCITVASSNRLLTSPVLQSHQSSANNIAILSCHVAECTVGSRSMDTRALYRSYRSFRAFTKKSNPRVGECCEPVAPLVREHAPVERVPYSPVSIRGIHATQTPGKVGAPVT